MLERNIENFGVREIGIICSLSVFDAREICIIEWRANGKSIYEITKLCRSDTNGYLVGLGSGYHVRKVLHEAQVKWLNYLLDRSGGPFLRFFRKLNKRR